MQKRPLPSLLLYLILLPLFFTCKKSTEQEVSTGDTTVLADTTPATSQTVAVVNTPYQPLHIAVDFEDNEPAKVLFKKIYPDDSLHQLTEDMVGIDVRITAWEYIYDGELFSSSGKCEAVKILRLDRQDGNGTFIDWLVLAGETISSPLTVDVTENQSEHHVDLSFDNSLSPDCLVATVSEDESGGDIDLHESSYITFYAVDSGGFSEIITIQLAEKLIRDYYAEGTEPTGETNTSRDYTILGSVTNGLYDIQIITTDLIDQSEAANSDGEICKWNGSSYDCNMMMVD